MFVIRNNPFNVVCMDRNLFLDTDQLQCKITNRSAGIFKNGKVFVYDANYKQGFSIKAEYHQAVGTQVKLQKTRSDIYDIDIFNLSTVDTPPKYPRPIKLDDMKLSDLRTLLPYIPVHHKPFMEQVISEQEALIDVPYVNDHQDDFVDYC